MQPTTICKACMIRAESDFRFTTKATTRVSVQHFASRCYLIRAHADCSAEVMQQLASPPLPSSLPSSDFAASQRTLLSPSASSRPSHDSCLASTHTSDLIPVHLGVEVINVTTCLVAAHVPPVTLALVDEVHGTPTLPANAGGDVRRTRLCKSDSAGVSHP